MLKKGDGASTVHALNKQGANGPGASNTPLKKSTVNKQPPDIADAKGHGGGKPKHAPQAAAKKEGGRGTVAVNEKKPHGRDGSGATFTAPRKEGSKDPVDCGYTHLGKA